MAACAVCGADLPEQRGPRARRYCSRACQGKAYRARQQQRDAHRLGAGAEQRLVDEYAGVASLQLADHLAAAARRLAGALTAGKPTDDFDLGVLARIPVVLAARAQKAATAAPALHGLPAYQTAPTATTLDLAGPPKRPASPEVRPSHDDSVPTSSPALSTAPLAARRQRAAHASRDDSASAVEPAPKSKGIEPRPQKLSKRRAQAIVDAAELVRDSEHRENHRWVLRSGDTVLGYVEPSYGGVSRSGRNGWVSRLAGMPGPRGRTRDAASADLAMRWVRLVTATPKRTITGA